MEEILNENESESPKPQKSLKELLPIIIAIVAIVVLVVGGILIAMGSGNADSKSLKLIFDEDKLIPVKVGDKCGYISPKNGKMVIEPTFKNVSTFYGKYASVEYSDNGTTKYGIIDKSGKIKLSADSKSDIKVVSEYGLYIVNGVLYNDNLKALTDSNTTVYYEDSGYCSYIKKNKLGLQVEAGIYNPKGKKIYKYKLAATDTDFSCKISDASESLKEVYAVVSVYSGLNSKNAIVNLSNGKYVYKFTDKDITSEDDNIFSLKDNSSSDTETFLCAAKNKIAYQTSEYTSVSYYDYDKKILELYNSNADSSNRYAYYDLNKKKVLSEKPEKTSSDELASLIGYSSYSNNGKYGVMKKDKVILSSDYDKIEFLSPTTFNYIKNTKKQELVVAKKGDEYSLINLKNKKAIKTFNATSVTTYSTSTFIKGKLKDSSETFVYNLSTGKMMTFDKNASVSVYSNYVTATKDGTTTYYNTKLKEIYKADK